MGFWDAVGKAGIFKVNNDKGNHYKTVVLSGQKILDQTQSVVRTIDSGKRIRSYDADTAERLK